MAETTLRVKLEADSKQAVQDTDKFATSVDNLSDSTVSLNKNLVRNTNVVASESTILKLTPGKVFTSVS